MNDTASVKKKLVLLRNQYKRKNKTSFNDFYKKAADEITAEWEKQVTEFTVRNDFTAGIESPIPLYRISYYCKKFGVSSQWLLNDPDFKVPEKKQDEVSEPQEPEEVMKPIETDMKVSFSEGIDGLASALVRFGGNIVFEDFDGKSYKLLINDESAQKVIQSYLSINLILSDDRISEEVKRKNEELVFWPCVNEIIKEGEVKKWQSLLTG